MPELFVTNFNQNFTGVSATTSNVLRYMDGRYDFRLVGHALPNGPEPISVKAARALCETLHSPRPFAIWHVRRNSEMYSAILTRDLYRLPIKIVFTSAAQRRHSVIPRLLISRMDAVIATTETAADYVPHVRAIIPHGVDTHRFFVASDRESAWRRLGFGGTSGIATIGRIRPEKGTDRFVDAMIHALPTLPGVMALIVGREEKKYRTFKSELKTRIKNAGLADRILFTGETSFNFITQLMQGLSIVMQLPRYEGYGMVPLEAMASGVPFIASNVGNFTTFAGAGRTGLIVQPSDAAGAVKMLLQNPARLDAMSRNARKDATQNFSALGEAEAVSTVYESLWAEA